MQLYVLLYGIYRKQSSMWDNLSVQIVGSIHATLILKEVI